MAPDGTPLFFSIAERSATRRVRVHASTSASTAAILARRVFMSMKRGSAAFSACPIRPSSFFHSASELVQIMTKPSLAA